ncbi:MAG: amidohydrolase family protein [Gammaproteobacteria bacterium]|nr:amidohydrolase family protein [Gammaproteobacteria bacterium]
MTGELLIKNVRPMGGKSIDVLVKDGFIRQMEPDITSTEPSLRVLDGRNQLLLPGLVNAHAHVDKNLLGLPWHKNQVPGQNIRDYADYERRVRRELNVSAEVQSAYEIQAAIAAGVTHIRSHVDIDTDSGINHFEGVMATREAFKDRVTIQLVAFPQSGMLVRPGTVKLLEEAVKMGADCIGGLDPSAVERDPVRHLDTIFDIADRYGVEVDIHLHEPGMLGAFAVELIAERTHALGLQGRVTISHVFCLGMVDEGYLTRLIDLLLEHQIAIMSLGSGRWDFPPLKRLNEAGVALCTGSDSVRDTWGPYNSVDMLNRVKLLGYRSAFRKDEDIEIVLQMATYGGAQVMGDTEYGLDVGKRADFVVVAGDTPAQAVIEQPPRAYVVKHGNLTAVGGEYLQTG